MQWILWLIATLIAGLAGFWVYKADKKQAVPYPLLTAGIRGLLLFATIALLLIPAIETMRYVTEKPLLLFLQDNSASVSVALGKDSAAYRKSVDEQIEKLSKDYHVVKWGFGERTQPDTVFSYTQPFTNITNALSEAQEYYEMQNFGGILLATDGKFNAGANPALASDAIHVPIYTIAIGDSSAQKDLKVARIYANKSVAIHSTFEIRADIVATLCSGYNNTIVLKCDGHEVTNASVNINTNRYDRSLSFNLSADKAGMHHYSLTLPPAVDEKNVNNNVADIYVEVVEDKKKILIAAAAPHPDVNAIRDALAPIESYQVFTCTEDNFPPSLANYDALILHGLPSARNPNLARTIAATGKPMMFIYTTNTNAGAFNTQLNTIMRVTAANTASHDVLARYYPSFNSFTLPAQVQTVVDKMPPLQCAANIPLPVGATPLFYNKVASTEMPLWYIQSGSVPVALINGEGIWRWRLYEYKNFNTHEVVDELIRQSVNYICADTKQKPFTASMPKYIYSDREPVVLNAYLKNANNELINTPDALLSITDSNGKKYPYNFERMGNSYFINLGLWSSGTYTYTASTTLNDNKYTATGSFHITNTPIELSEQGADYAMLYTLAHKHQGAFFTTATLPSLADSVMHNKQIQPRINSSVEYTQFIDKKWYFVILLALGVAEWLLRKYWLAQ